MVRSTFSRQETGRTTCVPVLCPVTSCMIHFHTCTWTLSFSGLYLGENTNVRHIKLTSTYQLPDKLQVTVRSSEQHQKAVLTFVNAIITNCTAQIPGRQHKVKRFTSNKLLYWWVEVCPEPPAEGSNLQHSDGVRKESESEGLTLLNRKESLTYLHLTIAHDVW